MSPRRIALNRGLDLALPHCAEQRIDACKALTRVAVLGSDYPGLRPSVRVRVGDQVAAGQTLFEHRHDSRVKAVSTHSGRVASINRGPRRSLESIVIALDSAPHSASPTPERDGDSRQQLLDSGWWSSLRGRPPEAIPDPDACPTWLFVNAAETRPGAPNPGVVVAGARQALSAGLELLAGLGSRHAYFCHGPELDSVRLPDGFEAVVFDGPHPAGLVGTHIAHLARPGIAKEAWHLDYQDVINIGHWRNGTSPRRVVAIGGAGARRPRLLEAPLGANLAELLRGEITGNPLVVSGPLPGGKIVNLSTSFIGAKTSQLWLLPELAAERRRAGDRFFYWASSALGLARPAGTYGVLAIEPFRRIWPHPNELVPLLRALRARDVDAVERLGGFALAEEDFALASLVCPSERDYGRDWRRTIGRLVTTQHG